MIVNGRLRDFVCSAIAKGQITLGDVRRLQRGYLPGGITNRELEILISLNAKVIRADKVWAPWLVSVIADFVTKREPCESFEDPAAQWVERLLAASATNLGRRIARQIRRRLRAAQSPATAEGVQACGVQQPCHVGVPARPPCSNPPRRRLRPGMIPTTSLANAAHCWSLALRRSDLINFQGSRVCLVMAPCL
jgi:hypothetical protein